MRCCPPPASISVDVSLKQDTNQAWREDGQDCVTHEDESNDEGNGGPCDPAILCPIQGQNPQDGKYENSHLAGVCVEALELSLLVMVGDSGLTQAMRHAPMNDEPRYPAGRVIYRELACGVEAKRGIRLVSHRAYVSTRLRLGRG